MSVDAVKCAKEIYEILGERGNLIQAGCCATRLRFATADNEQVDFQGLEQVDGVKGVFSTNGQIHILLDAGMVPKVYEQFLKISGIPAAAEERTDAKEQESVNLRDKIINFFSGKND